MKQGILIHVVLLALLGTGPALASENSSSIQLALTFDDLPWVGAEPVDGTPLDAISRMAAVLNAHNAPATGFVVCDRYLANPEPVDTWAAWGYGVGNHSSAHPDLNSTDTTAWIEDIRRCHENLGDIASYDGLFRFPMLHQGDTPRKRQAVVENLDELGMRNAHVTVDTSDWILTRYHAEAIKRGDARLRRAVGEMFIEHILAAVKHADEVARRKLGRQMPQILLLHANSLVEDYLDELLIILRTNGVEFVSVETALADPAYAREDAYVGPKGLSWLYRMKPLSLEDVAWDDAEAARIRKTLDAEFAAADQSKKTSSISALPVGDRKNRELMAALQEAGSSERWRSLIIAKDDEIMLEAYFNGVDETTPANLKSVTKSLTAMLVGVALQKGWLDRLEDPVAEYLEAHGEKINERSVSLASLLTMSSGFIPVPYAEVQQQSDWVDAVISAGISKSSQGTFTYDTPVLQLLTAAVEKTSSQSAQHLANTTLLAGSTEKIPYWRKDPAGYSFGGNDAYLTPRGMLELGRLMLNEGALDGRKILDADFVEDAISVRIKPESETINHETLPVRGYGYLWWLTEIGGEQAAAALGHGGQMIYVVPKENTVIVVTSRWPMASSTEHYQHVTRMLNETFLPMTWNR